MPFQETGYKVKPFDGARYKYLLGKYKDMEPEKLEALIEEEFKDFNGDNADLSWQFRTCRDKYLLYLFTDADKNPAMCIWKDL